MNAVASISKLDALKLLFDLIDGNVSQKVYNKPEFRELFWKP
jgi:hypothetical protein